MNVARESTVERMGDDVLLDERSALDWRVTRSSEDSPPVLGPCSELDARRLDPAPQDMSCDMGKFFYHHLMRKCCPVAHITIWVQLPLEPLLAWVLNIL